MQGGDAMRSMPRRAALMRASVAATALLAAACTGDGNVSEPADPIVGLPNARADRVVGSESAGARENGGAAAPPPTLEAVRGGKRFLNETVEKPDQKQALKLRKIRETALSYGARAGLARRSYEIARQLEDQAEELRSLYDLSRLAIPAPKGAGVIVPPIVTEGDEAFAVSDSGDQATVSERVYRIVEPAKLRAKAPVWRTYLKRTWRFPEPPPRSTWPSNERELEIWRDAVAEGWKRGREQANEIFKRDLNRLTRHYTGMALYHKLLEMGVIENVYVASNEVPSVAEGDQLKIGQRSVRIVNQARFVADADSWRPVVVRAKPEIGPSTEDVQ